MEIPIAILVAIFAGGFAYKHLFVKPKFKSKAGEEPEWIKNPKVWEKPE